MTTKTLSVVFTDIKGFTERTSKSSRADMLHILRKHEELLKPIIVRHGGSVIKTIGDAFLLTFDSPTNAVLCGLRMQARLREYNTTVQEELRIEIRIAINTGEVEVMEKDVFGEAVNLASRLEGVTETGEVYFTESTYLSMKKAEVPTSEVGEFRFKGIPEAVKVYRVMQDENLDLYRRVLASQQVYDEVEPKEDAVPEGAYSMGLLVEALELQQAQRRRAPILWAAATVALLVLVGIGYLGVQWYQYRTQRAQAEEWIEAGRIQESLVLLVALRAEKPADMTLLELLGRAVEADINQLLAQRRFEEALQKVDSNRERFPNLAVLDSLQRDVRLAAANERYRNSSSSGRRAFEKLARDYPEDLKIKSRFMLYLALESGKESDWRRAGRLYRAWVESDPAARAGDQWFLEGIRNYLASNVLNDRTLKRIDDYYEALEPFLREHIGDWARGPLRWNAYRLLQRRLDLRPHDEFLFFTGELFYRTFSAPIPRLYQETFGYFEKRLESGWPAEIRNNWPSEFPKVRTSSSDNPDIQRAQRIIQTLYPKVWEDAAR